MATADWDLECLVLQANMLGLPAISVPCGTDSKGLPIGLQITGKSWNEATLLRMAAVLEAAQQATPLPAPELWVDPITGAGAGLV